MIKPTISSDNVASFLKIGGIMPEDIDQVKIRLLEINTRFEAGQCLKFYGAHTEHIEDLLNVVWCP